MSETTRRAQPMTRRHWMGHLASTALGDSRDPVLLVARSAAQQLRKTNRSCIVLWMGGGPSHLDIWDLKPDSEKNGGPFRPIETSAPGVKITRASAQGRQADASPEHHSLAGFQGRESRSRHVHDAHRLHAQPDGRAPGLGARTAPSSWASGLRISTCLIASRSTRRAWARASWGCRMRRSWCRTRTLRSPI